MFSWLGKLFPKPPRPSTYIDQFLDGKISSNTFASNISDGWVGSDLGEWSWLDQIHDIERRHNPDFPAGVDVWSNPEAREELRVLADEFRTSGR